MRAVNLLPRDELVVRRAPRPTGPVLLAGLLLVIVAAIIGGAFMLERGKVDDRRAQLEQLQSDLRSTPPPKPEPEGNAILTDEKGKRVVALADALSTRVAFDRVLRQLSLVLPSDVWLSSLRANSPYAAEGASTSLSAPAATPAASTPPASGTSPPPAAAASTSSTFAVTGYTYSQEGVARLLARLSVVPSLVDVRLDRSERIDTTAQRPIVQFAISASVRAPKAGS